MTSPDALVADPLPTRAPAQQGPRPSAQARGRLTICQRVAFVVGPPVVAVSALLGVWEAYVQIRGQEQYILVAPSVILRTLFSDLGYFASHGQTTLLEAISGLALGGVVAFIAAAAMSEFEILDRALMPIAVLAKVTPMVAIAPLLIIWLGFGLLPKVLIAGLITFFPILINCISGFRSLDRHVYEVMRSVHASRWEVFLKLRLPQSLPHLFAALKISVSLSLIGAIVAEFEGSSRGLGNVITQSAMYLDMDRMFAAIAILALMGLTLTFAVTALERRALRWLGAPGTTLS